MNEIIGVPGAFRIDGLLTSGECEELILACEKLGFRPKKSRRSGPPIRDNQRVLFEPTLELTLALESRLRPLIAQVSLEAIGSGWGLPAEGPFLNSKWRMNRYATGESFRPHFDTGHAFSSAKRTLLSLIVYLNDDFEGGETVFFPRGDERQSVGLRPKAGSALLFHHYGPLSPLHGTGPITASGRPKYVARTDLTFEDHDFTLKRLLFEAPAAVRQAVLLLGVPGAGKSTQLEVLSARRGYTTLNFGQCVRGLKGRSSPLALSLAAWRDRTERVDRQPSFEATKWLPDDLSAHIFEQYLPPVSNDLLLLDGYPRKRSQSLALECADWLLTSVIHLHIPPEVQHARLAARAATDRPTDALELRMRDWERDTYPLVEHYRKRGLLDEVDGTQSTGAVADAIEKIIEARSFDLIASFLPKEARETLEGYTPTKVNLSKKYRVYRFSNGLEERYLKVVYEPSSRHPSSYEGPVLAAVKAEGFPFDTPVVLSHFSLGPNVNGVISKRVPGITVKEVMAKNLVSEQTVLEQWARALARIHAFRPRHPEKFLTRDVQGLLAIAQRRVADHVIRPSSFSAKYGVDGPVDLERELAELETQSTTLIFDQLRLNHGDPCAPNFIWSEERGDITGCVDLSGICATDLHWDVSIACWSLNHNAKRDRSVEFMRAYAAAMRDEHGLEVRVDRETLRFMYRLARFLL
jgi:adenylate kinase family enzyme/aminoglycoside phosphotransferase